MIQIAIEGDTHAVQIFDSAVSVKILDFFYLAVCTVDVRVFCPSLPIGSPGGPWSDVLFNRKYANRIYKVTVALDILDDIVCFCPLACSEVHAQCRVPL